MSDIQDHEKQKQSPRRFALLGALIPVALIVCVASAYLVFWGGESEQANEVDDRVPIVEQKDYYLLIRTIELYPHRPGGKDWDRLDNTAPDIRYDVVWQGNTVFESKVRSDTLIGSWDAVALDLKSAILNGQVDLGSSISAAVVRAESGVAVTVNIWDADIADKDEAGTLTLQLADMVLGDNELVFESSEDNAVKRVVVRLIDKSLPLAELLEVAAAP